MILLTELAEELKPVPNDIWSKAFWLYLPYFEMWISDNENKCDLLCEL